MGTWQGDTKLTSTQPAIVFEEKAGVTGIAQRYTFPGGISAEEFDVSVSNTILPFDDNGPEMTARLHDTFNALARLNPGVETLPHKNDFKKMRFAIFGVASSFNLDDIRYFLEYPDRTGRNDVARASHGEVEYDILDAAIERRTGVRRGWVACPETLRKIFDQVRDRPPIHPVQIPEEWRPKYPLRDLDVLK